MSKPILFLPPVKNRREFILPVRWLHPRLDFACDADFLFYRVAQVLFISGTLLLLFLIADVKAQTGLLIDPEAFASNNLVIAERYRQIFSWLDLAAAIAFYLVLSAHVDYRTDYFPIILRPITFEKSTRTYFRNMMIFYNGMLVLSIAVSDKCVGFVAERFEREDSLPFLIFIQSWVVMAGAYAPVALVSNLLLWKIARKDFNVARQYIQRHGAKALWDK